MNEGDFMSINVPKLEKLNISKNHLRGLPDIFFSKAAKLVELNISHNFIEEIPKRISDLRNLKVLAINGNKFSKLPVCLANIKLTELKLDWPKYLGGKNDDLLSGNGLEYLMKTLRAEQGGHLSIARFLERATFHKEKVDLNQAVDRDFDRAVIGEDQAVMEQMLVRDKNYLRAVNTQGLNPYNLAIRYDRERSIQYLLSVQPEFDPCRLLFTKTIKYSEVLFIFQLKTQTPSFSTC